MKTPILGRHFRHHRRGQSAVEFALTFPIFILIIIGFIEFAIALSTLNSLNFVARDAALVAAEGGDRSGTDCTMLTVVEREFGAAGKPTGIGSVSIYWSDQNGNVLGNAVNRYDRQGSLSCVDLDGVTHTLPYTAAAATYPENVRCNVLIGCAGGHTVLDTIGIRITYVYDWRTPLSAMIGPFITPTFTSTQQMRMEPIL